MKELYKICCLTIIMAFAACEDIAHLKVRNGLVIYGWCMGLFFKITEFGVCGVIYWIMGVTVPLCLLSVLFCFRMFGAADIKLISVIGGFYGAGYSIKVFVMALFIGGVLSVIRCIRFGYLKNRLRYFAEYIKNIIRTKAIDAYYISERDEKNVAIPFSTAIGVGFLAVYSGLFN